MEWPVPPFRWRVFPAGTANCLGHELGLGKNLERVAGRIGEFEPVRLALGLLRASDAAPRHFLMFAGAGLDARVIAEMDHDFKRRTGKFAYWAIAFRLVGKRLTEFDVRAGDITRHCGFALAARVRNYGGDLQIARGASLLRPDFETVLMQGATAGRYLKYLLGVGTGTLGRMRGATIHAARSIEMIAPGGASVPVQVDGELAGTLPATIEIVGRRADPAGSARVSRRRAIPGWTKIRAIRSHPMTDRRGFLKSAVIAGAPAILPAQTPSDTLRVAFVGVGNRGSFLLQNMLRVAGVRVVAVCDIVPDRAAAAAKTVADAGGSARQWTDFRKMLDEQKDIDAVVLATPDFTHKDFDIAILEVGKHLYAEKPLALTADDCKAVGAPWPAPKASSRWASSFGTIPDATRLDEVHSLGRHRQGAHVPRHPPRRRPAAQHPVVLRQEQVRRYRGGPGHSYPRPVHLGDRRASRARHGQRRHQPVRQRPARPHA